MLSLDTLGQSYNVHTSTSKRTPSFIVQYPPHLRMQKNSIREQCNVQAFQEAKQLPIERWYIETPENNVLDELQSIKSTYPGLEIQPEFSYTLAANPNDSLFYQQWNLSNHGQNGCTEKVDIAWKGLKEQERSTGDVIIGILDSGIDWQHPDLAENIWQNLAEDLDQDGRTLEFDPQTQKWVMDPDDIDHIDNDGNGYVDDLIGWDFVNNDNNPYDDLGHGTHVAGIIGASSNNQIGVSGICQNAQLMPLKFLNQHGIGQTFNALEALEYAVSMGASVTNNSWGGYQFDPALLQAIEQAALSDVFFVAAAGNNSNDNDANPLYPSAHDVANILTVAAIDCQGELASFSNFGAHQVDIGAPGEGILSTLPNKSYGFMNGSSMAAPHISASLAILQANYPNESLLNYKERILETAQPLATLTGKCLTNGCLQLESAFRYGQLSQPTTIWDLFTSTDQIKDIAFQGDFIWIATQGGFAKLYTVDGSYELFTTANSDLPSNDIHTIWLDSQQKVWITTSMGIVTIDGTQWTVDTSQDFTLITANPLTHTLWAASEEIRTGIHYLDQGTWRTTPAIPNSIPVGVPHKMLIDLDGHIWIATTEGLVIYNGNAWATFNPAHIKPITAIKDILLDHDGHVWILGSEGVARFEGLGWSHYTLPNSQYGTPQPKKMAMDAQGLLWVLTNHLQTPFFSFDGSQWNAPTLLNEVKWDTYTQSIEHAILKIDPTGAIWHTVVEGELHTFQSNIWNQFSLQSQTHPTTYITAVEMGESEEVWVGTRKGLYRFDNDQWNKEDSELPEKWISSLSHPANHPLFVNTSTHLASYQYNTWRIQPNQSINIDAPRQTIGQNNIFTSPIAAPDGVLWLADKEHLYYFDQNAWTSIDIKDVVGAQTPIQIQQLLFDAEGQLWVSGNFGIITHKNGLWKQYTPSNSALPSLHTAALSLDHEDAVWIGAEGALIKVSPAEWESFTPNNAPLSNELVQNIEVDEFGLLWVAQGNKLLRFDNTEWNSFDYTNSSIPNASITDLTISPKGTVWVGTTLGLAKFESRLPISFLMDTHTLCLNERLYLTSIPSPRIQSLEWRINGQIVSTDAQYSAQFAQAGTHTITLTARANDGAIGSLTKYVEVHAVQTLELGAGGTHCGAAKVLESGIEHGTYLWKNSLGDTLSTAPNYTVTQSGNYILQVVDACEQFQQDSITVILTGSGTCVWAGDVNEDGKVNAIDLLLLGTTHGETGPARPNASTEWNPQAAPNWTKNFHNQHPFAPETNYKNLDCDGDGHINISRDGAVIKANSQHPYTYTASSNNNINFRVKARQNTITLGDTLKFDMFLEDTQTEWVQDIYGIAFSLQYHHPMSQEPKMDISHSWMGQEGQNLYAEYLHYPQLKRMDWVITRFDQFNVSGSGKVSGGGITVYIEDLGDISPLANHVNFSMSYDNVLIIQQDGTPIPLSSLGASGTVNVTIEIPNCGRDLFEPNDTKEEAKEIPETGIMNNALICRIDDQDWFTYTTTADAPYVAFFLHDLPANYDIEIYNSLDTLVSRSYNQGKQDEIAIYNTSNPDTYYIKIVGGEGHPAWDPFHRYSLRAYARNQPFNNGFIFREEASSIEEVSDQPTFAIYPNPTSSTLTIQNISSHTVSTYTIRDIQGRKLQEGVLNQTKTQISLQSLSTGLYLLDLAEGGVHKIIKR